MDSNKQSDFLIEITELNKKLTYKSNINNICCFCNNYAKFYLKFTVKKNFLDFLICSNCKKDWENINLQNK